MRRGTWVLGRAQGRASRDGEAFCQSPVVWSRERGTDGSSDCEEERAHTNPGELEGWAGIIPEAH